MLSIVLASGLVFWRRRYLVVALPAVLFLLPYVTSGAANSRYSVPLWPLGVAAHAGWTD